MLLGLTTLWRSAVGTSSLHYHMTGATVAIGVASSTIVCVLTIGWVLRKQGRRPARELLESGAEEPFEREAAQVRKRSKGWWVAIGCGVVALATVGWAIASGETANAEYFFTAGFLLLIAGFGWAAATFAALGRSARAQRLTLGAMGLRNTTRRRKRSLATVALLACGSFLVIAVGANRLNAQLDADKPGSGTGGFALIGRSTLPVVHDLNTADGRDFFGLDPQDLRGVEFVSFRVRDGDDASCLNLNRAQQPRLLGVDPEPLNRRGAFTFAKIEPGLPEEHPWLLLEQRLEDGAVPAVADVNSIVWALGKKVGDTLTFTDGYGQPFEVRLVGALANSILQGSLMISEKQFLKRFPAETGYRMFLIDAPSEKRSQVSAALSRAMQDVGLELAPAAARLAEFNAVENTYLSTFQILGGIGLLLGSVGLGVVVLRNVLERRSELALLQAVGFERGSLHWLVLSEHLWLLGLGLGVGVMAALVAILPALVSPGAEIPYVSLGWTLAAVLVSGILWTWGATWLALRGQLLMALRNE